MSNRPRTVDLAIADAEPIVAMIAVYYGDSCCMPKKFLKAGQKVSKVFPEEIMWCISWRWSFWFNFCRIQGGSNSDKRLTEGNSFID